MLIEGEIKAEFSIEPCNIRELLWKPAVPLLVPGVGITVIAIINSGAVAGPIVMGAGFAVAGFIRSIFWVVAYRKNAFRLDLSGVTLTSLKKRRSIPLDEISGIRFLVPAQSPAYQHGGFQAVELELKDGKKVKHKVAIFKEECVNKWHELQEVAPHLGFKKDETKKLIGGGFWRK
ncbi:hypothetical protein [Streptomonospora alba]|uniref:hypothetical protein n=1 Tax=Streptomonospora alba TaxID=183763 RepID=UPI0012EDFB5B|nr:hypothetical protein [Streptomonospora alba]